MEETTFAEAMIYVIAELVFGFALGFSACAYLWASCKKYHKD